jgi:ATP-dependent DNA helicase RecG
MPQERFRQLVLERLHPMHRWETQPAHGFWIDDLDLGELTVTVEEAVRRTRLADPGTRDPAHLLRGLRLMQGGQVLNAAVALFGRADRFLPHYPQCLLRLARFRGKDKTEFIDNRRETGNAFDLLLRAQRFLRDHLPVAGRVVPELFERVDDPLYPPVALREALANALCHRDYAMPGGSVGIALYDDRLEITSTGRLPFGLTPEDLTVDHTSLPWNPLIAGIFHLRGIIEQWGRGTQKIRALTEEAGLVAPEFEVRGGEVVVRFHPTRYVAPSRVSRPLSPLQQRILEALSEIGPATLGEVDAHLGAGTPKLTVKDNLHTLRQLELVKLTGRARTARWSLI